MYEVKDPLWQFVDHWQTLAAGLLALVAAVGAVLSTLAAANRQIKAANEAADRQITAAQGQTQASQRQTAVMREIERRRLAREGYAFHAMLEAASGSVIEDVEAARNLPPPPDLGSSYSVEAYAVRQRVQRTGFAELRNAFLRFGGPLTAQFLQLDKEIERFAGQFMMQIGRPVISTTSVSTPGCRNSESGSNSKRSCFATRLPRELVLPRRVGPRPDQPRA
jgi:multidrug efflux pump subunit AcrA (membrane-fusion protein)